MTDTTSKYHSLLQQQHPQQQHTMHPLATIAHSAPYHSSGNTAITTPGLIHPDSSSPIDFTHNDAFYMGPTSPLEDLEDLDYQSGFASYQKQHLVPRHTSLPGAMDLGLPSSNIPIKQDTTSFYNGEYDTFPMSAPAATHLNTSSPTYANSIYIHPQYLPKSMDSPESAPRSFEDDDYNLQMNMQIMMDKRRRRRESHNAVERRRRENINDRIQELGTLLPETMTDMGTSSNTSNKQNKGAILRHSVEHIRYLQHEVQSYSMRVKELESALAKLQSK